MCVFCRWVKGLRGDVPSAPSLVLAVCVHSAVEQKGVDTENVKAKLTLIQQHREVRGSKWVSVMCLSCQAGLGLDVSS